MQSVKKGPFSNFLRSPMTWGAAAIAFGVVVSLVLAVIYLNPPGHDKIVSFYTDDAGSIRSGDEIRMAGIKVGVVKDLALERDQVLVRAQIEESAFVGDQSQVDVRMLTVVGGYYVNLTSIGDAALGTNPIPRQRVTMPYSLIRALTDTTKITQNVKTVPINQSLNEVQKGLNGTNVQTLSAMVDAGNSVMSTIDSQRGQVTKILNLSDEYIQSLAGYRGQIEALIRKVSIITQSLVIYGKGIGQSLIGIGDIVLALKTVADFYENHRVDFIEKVRDYQFKTRLFVERNGDTVRGLHRIQNLLERVLDAQNASPGLLATDLCIPVPGSAC